MEHIVKLLKDHYTVEKVVFLLAEIKSDQEKLMKFIPMLNLMPLIF